MATTYQLDDYVPFGSALRGHLDASYIDLVEVFGEPNIPFSDKIWNEWAIRFTVPVDDDPEDSDDVYVTIYDWKESHPNQSRYGEYRWNIGGRDHRSVELIYEALGR